MGILTTIRQHFDRADSRAFEQQEHRSFTPPWEPGPSGGFAVVDVETTGLVPTRDRVVEIAVIATDVWGRVVDEWATLVNPCGPVGATRIHGISAADIRPAPRFLDVIGELNARLAGRALVAHNAAFDLGFLHIEYARAGWDLPPSPHLCTLEASWVYLPGLSRRRLADCCRACGIRQDNAHSALCDARATANLLAAYLDPNFGPPPLQEHMRLPAGAAGVGWPHIPRSSVTVVRREPTRATPPPTPASAGALAALLDDLPLSSAVDEGAPAGTAAYLELLAEALEDGVLTVAEAASLAALAEAYSLTRDQVIAGHRGFLLALAHKAIEDGRVTHDERDQLLATAAVLGFPDGVVKAVLDEARNAFATQKARTCKALPPCWPHGDPLRIGDGAAFTGCDDLIRARLEGRAQAAGLRVTGSVSRKTAVLVTDGVNPHTTKAQAARQFNTRVVSPDVFAELVEYVQPAQGAVSPAVAISGAPVPITPDPGIPASYARERAEGSTASGPAIRAWAREQGLPVGARGRLPDEVVAAYNAAHPGAGE